MYKIDAQLSRNLRNLTCICTVLILLLHLPIPAGYSGLLGGAVLFLKRHVVFVAVPLFFAMSGFLLAQHAEKGWYGSALKSRFRSLVIPYLAVNTVLIPVLFVYHNICHDGEWSGTGLAFDWYTISRVYGLTIYYSYLASGPFWYIRCLIMFVALSPLFVCVIRLPKKWAITFLVLLALGILGFEQTTIARSVWCQNFFYSFFNLRGVLMFCIGIFVAFHGRVLTRAQGVILLALSIVFAIVLSAKPCPPLSLVRMLSVAWVVWKLACLSFLRFPSWFSASCFAIYAFHETIYRVVTFAMKKSVFGGLLANDVGLVLPIVIAVGALCLFRGVLVAKVPIVNRILFGGR